MKRALALALAGSLAALGPSPILAAPADANAWSGRDPALEKLPGAQVYRENCAACHDGGIERAPQRMLLQDMTPQAIRKALTDGVMRAQGSALSEDQKIAVSEYISGRTLAAAAQMARVAPCRGQAARFERAEPPALSGWGLDLSNSHLVPAAVAGVNRTNVGSLKLKWAFAFPGATRARSQPTLAGGAVFVGSHNGSVYALDRETGCVRWKYDAAAEVRTGIVVSPWQTGDRAAKPLAFFGDVVGNVYAVNALTGAQVWKIEADQHPSATITAAPTLYDGTLYVPISSLEEASAAAPHYPCCTFRGSVLALDAATGRQKWRTWMAPPATLRGQGADGIDKFGPSGAAVWNSPAVDPGRGQLTVATSDNYSAPATDTSDSIIALDLATGRIKWRYQALAGDMWNVACFSKSSGACPDPPGPDYGFGAATILARGKDGHDYVLAGQKSGWAFAVDADTGQLAWKQRVGRGGVGAGIYFGMAAGDGRLFVPITDRFDGQKHDFPASPGLYALDIASGDFVWRAPADTGTCTGRKFCDPGYGSAITATPELVLSGSDDGFVRIFDAGSGKLLWNADTTQEVTAVGGAKAHGGAIGGGVAPLVYENLVLVSSGYSYGGSKMPGNVLLVYETAE